MSFPDDEVPELLTQALSELLEQERHWEEATIVGETPAFLSASEDSAYSRLHELGFNAQVLLANRTGDPAIVGIVSIEQESGRPPHVVPVQVAESVAEALAEYGDVDPMTCFAGAPAGTQAG